MAERTHRSTGGWRARLMVGLSAAAVCGGTAWAQPEPPTRPLPAESRQPIPAPDVADAVLKLIEAPYLNDDERKDLRIFHGVWREGDLDTPARRARAALIRGAYDDLALSDPSVVAEDRAEAAMFRGEYEAALETLKDATSLRAARIRAQSLEGLGRADEAAKALQPLVQSLRERPADAAELVDGVRALMIRARVRPQEEPAGGDYHRMASLLATARDRLDRLYWPALAVEANLLWENSNTREAGAAALQGLSLCPSSAEIWLLIGRVAVDGFNFDGAEQVAARLRQLDAPSSPWAACILARARLRQNDPDGADEALAPALERYPKMRPLLALRAAAAALRYDFDRAEVLAAEFDRLSPGSPDALYEIGRALAEGRQYERAADFLRRAAARAPFRAEPVAELGLMGLQSGHDQEAAEILRTAATLDPFNRRVTNSLRLVEELAGYERVESEHFIVRYKPGPDAMLAHEMATPLEAMYARVTGNGPGGIDHEPPGKTIIDLMPDARSFAVRIAGVTRIHTMAASTGPTIAMEAPREGAGQSVGTYDWLRVVRHEFTHTVTLSRTRNRIPHWFTEASAVYLEDAPRDYNTCRLLQGALESDSLFDFGEINLAFVRPKKPTDRAQAYAQGHWMYQYMVERWGDRAPLELMDCYARGLREEAAMREVLGIGLSEFMAGFKTWARGQLVEWGLALPPAVPTLGQILLAEAAGDDARRKGLAEALESAADGAAWAGGGGGGEGADWSPRLPRPDAAMVDRWLERYPEHPDLLEAKVKQAMAEVSNQPTPALVPLLERYAAARPVDPLPHQMLARIYLAVKDGETVDGKGPEGAIPHLEWLDAREQNSPAYAAELARQYAALEDWPKAAAKAERATIIAPFDADYRELAATVAVQHEDYDTAIRHITALTVIEPGRQIHQRRLEAVKQRRAQSGR